MVFDFGFWIGFWKGVDDEREDVQRSNEEEESDETLYWFEWLAEAKILPAEPLAPLMKEADEITAMTVASIKTLRARK